MQTPSVTSKSSRSLGSLATTHGVTVRVAPAYQPEQSMPDDGRYVWSYRIRITNESTSTIQLIARHWVIVDADGNRRDVHGDGVVGQQPRLAPGATFDYSSFCPLATRWGTMEGTFHCEVQSGSDIGTVWHVAIARFYLVATDDRARTPIRAIVEGENA